MLWIWISIGSEAEQAEGHVQNTVGGLKDSLREDERRGP
jgi:uncharacterized protein YjbJ (UPF0337 family)